MKFYETTYIVHSALQEGRLNDITESINNFVKSIGGEILYFDNWGRKKLSYMIEKQKYGTYIYIQFKVSDNSQMKNLNMEFEHNPNILRSLIVKIDEVDIFDKNQQEEKKKEPSEIKQEPKDEKVEEEAQRIINFVENSDYRQGISPAALLGAALYISCKKNKVRRSQLEIAKAVGTSEVTLRNRAKEIILIIDSE